MDGDIISIVALIRLINKAATPMYLLDNIVFDSDLALYSCYRLKCDSLLVAIHYNYIVCLVLSFMAKVDIICILASVVYHML